MHKTYDHRLKEAIIRSRNPCLIRGLHIPKFTASNWITHGIKDVVTVDDFDHHIDEIINHQNLKNGLDQATSLLELLKVTTRIFGFQIQYMRFPKANGKLMIIEALEKARSIVGLDRCLAKSFGHFNTSDVFVDSGTENNNSVIDQIQTRSD